MAVSLTPAQRKLRARVGAYSLHAQGGTSTRAATAVFLSRFERQALAAAAERGESLAPDELTRRAAFARKAYMGKLALKASRARSANETAPSVSETSPGAVREVRDGSATSG